MSAESKLHQQMALLRREYVKVQDKLQEAERKLSLLNMNEESLAGQLLTSVSGLFNKPNYSDVRVRFADRVVLAHKLVLAARGNCWSVAGLSSVEEIHLPEVSAEVGMTILKWVYTDRVEFQLAENFILELIKASSRLELLPLKVRCASALISLVTTSNCLKYYQVAADIRSESLKAYCGDIIANNWDDLKKEDFAEINPTLLHEMLNTKSKYPLHLAVKLEREDVVLLFLLEFSSGLKSKLDQVDPSLGDTPLQLALRQRHSGIAQLLVDHGSDLDCPDTEGFTLLHKAVREVDAFSVDFLLSNGASTSSTTFVDQLTPLHLVASCSVLKHDLPDVSRLVLSRVTDVNTPDATGRTPLHYAILNSNVVVCDLLLDCPGVNLDMTDGDGNPPLWYAVLHDHSEGVMEPILASRLIKRGAKAHIINPIEGRSLLLKAALMGDEHSALFFLQHGAAASAVDSQGISPLHAASKMGLINLVLELLKQGANPNLTTLATDSLQQARTERVCRFSQLRQEIRERLRQQKAERARAHAQTQREFEEKLHQRREGREQSKAPSPVPQPKLMSVSQTESNPFFVSLDDDSVVSAHSTSSCFNPFLERTPQRTSSINVPSSTSVYNGLADLHGVQTEITVSGMEIDGELITHFAIVPDTWGRTPLHWAVLAKQTMVIELVLNFRDRGGFYLDLNAIDHEGFSTLEIALRTEQLQVAHMLIRHGAAHSEQDSEGNTLLHKMILARNIPACLFLIEKNSCLNIRNFEGYTPLQMAVIYSLDQVVAALCLSGHCDMNNPTIAGDPPIWLALTEKKMKIANMLVRQGCDTTYWHLGPGGCQCTLLHRAIVERNEEAACFLIEHGTSINSPRKPGLAGEGGVQAWDGWTPLHIACTLDLDRVVQCLIVNKADVNSKDAEGRTPVLLAIQNGSQITTQLIINHPEVDLFVRDKLGQTPFSLAMVYRDNESAAAILAREPTVTEQYDSKGLNTLHTAVIKNDIESVLFLVSIGADLDSVTRDADRRTPVHLACAHGFESIVAQLIGAGCQTSVLDKAGATPLLVAAAEGKSNMVSLLIENRADVSCVDHAGNTALHLAAMKGSPNTVKVLLAQTGLDATIVNNKGRNVLHVLAVAAIDQATTIFDLIMTHRPNFPLNATDMEGNTALLLAYSNCAVNLCCSLVKMGALVGVNNNQGLSLFSAPAATRKLLFKLLDLLSTEPQWLEGPSCQHCCSKFNVTTRRHHCRHCGRLLCSRCSSNQMPVIKYNLVKPVRVCDVCFDFLTQGGRLL